MIPLRRYTRKIERKDDANVTSYIRFGGTTGY